MTGLLASAGVASATPSTTYWAPSTTYVQPFLVPHVTYDTYFGRTSGEYPVLTGLTIGLLPFETLQLEVGFDLQFPSAAALLLNAKLGIPEGALVANFPAIALGIFGVGTDSDATDYHALYGQVQKNLPWGGYVSVGGYYGAGSELLWTSSDGDENRVGFIGAVSSPDIVLDWPGLKKLIVVADIQTGKNVLGAGGVGLYIYFTDAIDLLTGPVFFFDEALQPGQVSWMWTVQLDIDVKLL